MEHLGHCSVVLLFLETRASIKRTTEAKIAPNFKPMNIGSYYKLKKSV